MAYLGGPAEIVGTGWPWRCVAGSCCDERGCALSGLQLRCRDQRTGGGATLGDGSPAAGRERLPSIDTTVPHSARFWDYSLGGKDNYPVDREVGEQVLLIDPDLRDGLPRVFWSGPSDTWYWRQASASCLTSAPGCLP
ncbi:MAG TPA: SAM-dependent methyltransferase [Pseudonocardiaceae bacterium]